MKLLLDENLSPRLVEAVGDLYPGSTHVQGPGLESATDNNIWEYAKAHGFAIVTKDADFAERSVLEHNPPKIIWLRLGNCTTDAVRTALIDRYEAIRGFLEEDRETCLVIGRALPD